MALVIELPGLSSSSVKQDDGNLSRLLPHAQAAFALAQKVVPEGKRLVQRLAHP